jgi:hypothetical protein
MKGKLTLVVLALTGFNSGCALIQDGVSNACTEIRDCVDDARERARNRRWAEAAWAETCSTDPRVFSADYANGFKAGFAEFLYCGHTEVPPLAPAAYRRFECQTPEGFHAIEEWYAGYRHGVSLATQSGYRRWITAPVCVPLPPPPPGAGNFGPTGVPMPPGAATPHFAVPYGVNGEDAGSTLLPAPRVAPPPMPVPPAAPPPVPSSQPESSSQPEPNKQPEPNRQPPADTPPARDTDKSEDKAPVNVTPPAARFGAPAAAMRGTLMAPVSQESEPEK